MKPLKVTHIIGSLDVGGAEICLLNMLQALPREAESMNVISLLSEAPLSSRIRALGVQVHHLNIDRRWPNPVHFFALMRRLRQTAPDVVVTWLHHSNLVGGLAAKLAGSYPVVWNIRHTHFNPETTPPRTRAVVRISGCVARWLPDAVLFVSRKSYEVHREQGYPRQCSVVIPNGFDVTHFAPRAGAGQRLRAELGIAANTRIAGIVARFHPNKDIFNFLAAANRIAQSHSDVHFLMVGQGMDSANSLLAAHLKSGYLANRLHLLGARTDVAELMAGMDLYISSSLSEAFPRAVGEAMACGVPVVTTNVGDSALLVGECGLHVPARDSNALASACCALLARPPAELENLGKLARERIEERFQLSDVALQNLAIWRSVASKPSLSIATDAVPDAIQRPLDPFTSPTDSVARRAA